MRTSLLIVFVLIGVASAAIVAKSCYMSQAQRQALVDAHNQVRNKLASGLETQGLDAGGQPAAQNMQAVSWNTELEQWSTNWAADCTTTSSAAPHRPTRNTVSGAYFGENIYWAGSGGVPTLSSFDVASAVTAWYSEVSTFPQGAISSYPQSFATMVGHYTQVSWAQTNQIGCGMAYCQNGQFPYTVEIVCNYLPGGNMLGSPMYLKGSPSCSSQGLATNSQYSSLCGTSSNPTVATASTCPAAPAIPTTSYGTTSSGWVNNNVATWTAANANNACYKETLSWIASNGYTVQATTGVFTPSAGGSYKFAVNTNGNYQWLVTCTGSATAWTGLGASISSPPLTNAQTFNQVASGSL